MDETTSKPLPVPAKPIPVAVKVAAPTAPAKPVVKLVAKPATPKPPAAAAKPTPAKVVAAAPAKKPVAKSVPKPASKAAAPLKRVVGAQLPRPKKPGPAMVKLASKLKLKFEPGECRVKGCTKKGMNKRAKWCAGHKKVIRKAQLDANNAVWRKRSKAGLSGHHLVYRNKPTIFTLANKEQAAKVVAGGFSTIKSRKDLEKVIQAAPKNLKKAVRA